MKAGIFALPGLALLMLIGCSSETGDSKFTVVTDNKTVMAALPALRSACPGLDKYSGQLSNVRTENNFRTSVVFDVADSNRIPDAYKAGGNTCFVEIDSDGKTIYIEKQACKSLCLDQVQTPTGQLKIALTGGVK